MRSIEITSSGYKEALDEALQQLQLEEKDVDVEVLKESGLLKKKVTLRVSEKVTGQLKALDFIRGTIERMGLNCAVELKETDEGYMYDISGEDVAHVIGYRGDVLDSLQYLALLVANMVEGFDGRIIVDGENYRAKRVQILSKLAKRLAFKAAKSGEEVKLEPMNPFERRVIHSALAEDKYVTTHSEGEEPARYIVITPNKRPAGGRDKNRGRNDRRRERPAAETHEKVSRSNIQYHTDIDMYDAGTSRNFKKKGFGKTKTYGDSKRFF